MECVICGFFIKNLEPARHLPRFIRCPNCTGLVTSKKEEALYPDTYFTEEAGGEEKGSIFSPMLNFFLWLRFRTVARFLRNKSGKILDYGCGNGKLVAYLRHKGLSVDGYDPSDGAVGLAKKRGLPVFKEIPEVQYEMIMLWHSLEHSEHPLADILSLKKNLFPHGRLLIAVPNGNCLESRLFGESWFCYDWPFHRTHFTPLALSTLLQKAGFYVISADYFNPEYTISSLTQTFLNLFLPKNVLYSFVSARRSAVSKRKLYMLGALSALILLICSPLLLLFFLVEIITGRTAAFMNVAELS